MYFKNKYLGTFVLILLVKLGFAQPDCRTIIGSHLTPIENSPFSWAVEGMVAGGVLTDRQIANWGTYGALDYTNKKHNFYFEGAYKNWYNSASNPEGEDPQTGLPDLNRPTQYHWGIRELFYQYEPAQFSLKIGVQGLKTSDYFLFDERNLGISASKTIGTFTLDGNIGTVNQRLARFQDVCGTRHLYNLFHRSEYNFVAEDAFQSNFGAIFITWKPRSGKTNDTAIDEMGDDEFESFETEGNKNDEFDSFSSDEFSEETSKAKLLKINELGLLFYEEFGEAFHEYKYYSGIFGMLELPFEVKLRAELVDQYILNDHALAYWVNLQKEISWSSGGNSSVQTTYLQKIDLNEGAHFYPSFSNLFLGEIMRLDAVDLPLLSASIKHNFAGKNHAAVQLNNVWQLHGEKTHEYDLIAGMKFFDHLRLTGILSYIESDKLDQEYWMSRLELRIAF